MGSGGSGSAVRWRRTVRFEANRSFSISKSARTVGFEREPFAEPFAYLMETVSRCANRWRIGERFAFIFANRSRKVVRTSERFAFIFANGSRTVGERFANRRTVREPFANEIEPFKFVTFVTLY